MPETKILLGSEEERKAGTWSFSFERFFFLVPKKWNAERAILAANQKLLARRISFRLDPLISACEESYRRYQASTRLL